MQVLLDAGKNCNHIRPRVEVAWALEQVDSQENREMFLGDSTRRISRRDLSPGLTGKINQHYDMLAGIESSIVEIENSDQRDSLLRQLSQHSRKVLMHYILDDLEKSRLEKEAERDPLTGLYNLRRFRQDLEAKIAANMAGLKRSTDRNKDRRISEPGLFALAYLDLDHLKIVNDTWGHPDGDVVLAEFANLLFEAEDPISYRLSGDEYALLITIPGRVSEVCQDILRKTRELRAPSERFAETPKTAITASIGVATYVCQANMPIRGQAEELIRKADIALYHAKKEGRDRFIMYEQGMRMPSEARVA